MCLVMCLYLVFCVVNLGVLILRYFEQRLFFFLFMITLFRYKLSKFPWKIIKRFIIDYLGQRKKKSKQSRIFNKENTLFWCFLEGSVISKIYHHILQFCSILIGLSVIFQSTIFLNLFTTVWTLVFSKPSLFLFWITEGGYSCILRNILLAVFFNAIFKLIMKSIQIELHYL